MSPISSILLTSAQIKVKSLSTQMRNSAMNRLAANTKILILENFPHIQKTEFTMTATVHTMVKENRDHIFYSKLVLENNEQDTPL